MNLLNTRATVQSGYAPINDLKMYYEIEGAGNPLVYIPPAFGFAGLKSFPALVQGHSVITVDLQGNGHTADIPARPISIEQYANDVVGLLNYLGITKADFFGESYGGNTAALIAIRYPEFVGRVVTYSATFGPPQIALNPTRLARRPRAFGFKERITRKSHPIRVIGPRSSTRLVPFNGTDFRRKSWLPSSRPSSSLSEITTSFALSMPLRLSNSSPTRSLR